MTLLRMLSLVRLALVPLAFAQLLGKRSYFPAGYEAAAWAALAFQLALALALFSLVGRSLLGRWRGRRRTLALAGLAADVAVTIALLFVYSFEPGQPLRALLFLVVLEAAFVLGERGGVTVALIAVPILAGAEAWRSTQFGYEVQVESVVVRAGVALVLGLVVGRLVRLQAEQEALALSRAEEAERLRDQLGRRVDHLEATNRCARALGSSLELDAAFAGFIAELQALVPFHRAAILLVDGDDARVMATSGVAADCHLPRGSSMAVEGSVLERLIERSETVHREDFSEPSYPEEHGLLELGLRTRVLAPLQLGARSIGALVLARREPRSFRPEEVELMTLLGRLVASAVQNIRTYDAKRESVEELRRLSALRADFVSLVSHELRAPMAAVIGSARTLQARWEELLPEQRNAFLGLIGDETSRLAVLVGDVLDTSRIEAGTFPYTFDSVDLGALLREAIGAGRSGKRRSLCGWRSRARCRRSGATATGCASSWTI